MSQEREGLARDLADFEASVLSEDQVERERTMLDAYDTRRFGNALYHLVAHMTEDETVKPQVHALYVIGEYVEELGDPASLLKTFLDNPSEDVQLILGGIVASSLHKAIGPERVLGEFAELDPKKYWAIHIAMPFMFRVKKEWFRTFEEAHRYLDSLFRGDYPTKVREVALDAICRLFPYQSEIMKNAIRDAVEDDDQLIRGMGRSAWRAWQLKDRAIRTASSTNTPVAR